jgi:hypothetical protein
MTMNPFSEVSVMITPRKSERGSKPTPKGDDYSLSIALARSRAESASKAAAEKLQAEQDASAEQDEVANALVDIMESKPTPELIAEVSEINTQFLDELSRVQADYEVDINDLERRKKMDNFELKSLDDFATALYGEVGLSQIKRAYGTQGAVRKFFENYSGDQCQGALQKSNPFKEGVSKCWICGFVIPPTTSGFGFSMECEHVFPIAQAVFFIDLYRGSRTPEPIVELVQAEYDWSHRVCNQIKNDTHFVRITGEGANKMWVVSPDIEIRRFLRDLRDRSYMYFAKKGDTKNLLGAYIKNYTQWEEERLQVIKQRVQRVLDVGVQKCYPGIFTIVQVGKCLDQYDSLKDRVIDGGPLPKRRKVGSGTRRKKRKGTRRLKRGTKLI